MIRVRLLGEAGIGTQNHQRDMYRPAFERHPGFTVVGDDEEADAVSVALPLPERAAAIEREIRAGRHVLADKPLAATAAECERLATLAEEHNVVVVPAHHQRLGGALRSAKAAIRAGRVGLPWNVQCDFIVAGGDFAGDSGAGGELLNLGLYPIDIVCDLLGLAVTKVRATGGPLGTLQLNTLQLDHEHGVTSTIVVGRVPQVHGIAPAGLLLHRYRVSGSHGVLVIDATRPALEVRTAREATRAWIGPGTVDTLLDVFAAGIRTGRAELGPRDAVRAQRIVEAAQQSINEGRGVQLDAIR
ncbi:Gfo/Idh/MocA family oxidoreductase [Dactylosporangium sp. NPDC000244]|uniref:Gfo/Idh/MocA family protein n=1 Tax=Dactylosporangium sp. NPDC000244 TaxID=3154365 RepID=UPI00331DA2F0